MASMKGSLTLSRQNSRKFIEPELLAALGQPVDYQSPNDFKIKLLESISKLSSKDNSKNGTTEILVHIDKLSAIEPYPATNPTYLPVFVSCILEKNDSQSPNYKKEILKIIGALAEARKDDLQQHLLKISQLAVAFLKDKDTSVREECARTLRIVGLNVSLPQKKDSLSNYCKPFFKLMNETQHQVGTCMCLEAIISVYPPEMLVEISNEMFSIFSKLMLQSGNLPAPMITALATLIKTLKMESQPYIETFLNLCLQTLANDDWKVRKAGLESLESIAYSLNEQLIDYRDQVIQAVNIVKTSDKLVANRDLAKSVHLAYSSLGMLEDLPKGVGTRQALMSSTMRSRTVSVKPTYRQKSSSFVPKSLPTTPSHSRPVSPNSLRKLQRSDSDLRNRANSVDNTPTESPRKNFLYQSMDMTAIEAKKPVKVEEKGSTTPEIQKKNRIQLPEIPKYKKRDSFENVTKGTSQDSKVIVNGSHGNAESISKDLEKSESTTTNHQVEKKEVDVLKNDVQSKSSLEPSRPLLRKDAVANLKQTEVKTNKEEEDEVKKDTDAQDKKAIASLNTQFQNFMSGILKSMEDSQKKIDRIETTLRRLDQRITDVDHRLQEVESKIEKNNHQQLAARLQQDFK
eukprot:TRINITY_DN1694_c0_g1_i4.p1 TRINITY_DN1694_c0_g1~~TRINITY_DN1694_c0_g1_i4.p1  ORF type:complete len:629 (-),score=163.39 TRINITY_DN1694_c0_g1_i4:79-1965(-)